MQRKYNTVRRWQQSSLKTALMFEENKETLESNGLLENDYAICGGGFPIRIKGSNLLVGVITVSNLDHISDHEFIVDCLKRYMNKENVPSILAEGIE